MGGTKHGRERDRKAGGERDRKARWEGRGGAGRGRRPANQQDGAPRRRYTSHGRWRGSGRGPVLPSQPGRRGQGNGLDMGPVLAGRAERGRAGRLQRWRAVRAQAVASPARRPDWGNVWLAGVDGIVGVVLTLAGGCPARAAGLPGLVVFRLFIAVAHANSTAQPLLRAPEEVFNKLLRQTMMRLCRPDPGAQRIRQSQRATPGTGSAVHTSDNYPARDAAVSLSLGAPRAWCCSRGRRW